MTPQEKASELVEKFQNFGLCYDDSVECSIIAVENEYHSLRELLFDFMSSRIIENQKVYIKRLDDLLNEEKEVKQELNEML